MAAVVSVPANEGNLKYNITVSIQVHKSVVFYCVGGWVGEYRTCVLFSIVMDTNSVTGVFRSITYAFLW